jgi:hypothetical protein
MRRKKLGNQETPTMTVRVRCTKCSHHLRLKALPPDGVRCPSCDVLLKKRGAAAPAGFRIPWPAYVAGAGGAAAVLLLGVAVGGWLLFRNHGTRDNAAEDTTVSIAPPAPAVKAPPPRPAEKPEPAPQAAETQTPIRTPFKRLDLTSEDQLREQLLTTPELALENGSKANADLQAAAKKAAARNDTYPGPALVVSKRRDLQGLPLHKPGDSQLSKGSAENLEATAKKMRGILESTLPNRVVRSSSDVTQLRKALLEDGLTEWARPESVPCLQQMLQVEAAPVREVLVELLGRIYDKRATQALAKRAMTDLNPDVREAAVRQLAYRPHEDYRPLLLAGLRYPWAPVAVHSAEALAFLKDREAVPQMAALLAQPDPALAVTVQQGENETAVVREMVRVNHLGNCLLCHAPSLARTDPVRGAVPSPDKPIPPANSSLYYDEGTIFVRADTTYLRQDFSVMQTVKNPGKWPDRQRYDYVVRTRPATVSEIQLAARTPASQSSATREALLFALREITGKEYGPDGVEKADPRPAANGRFSAP